MRSIFILFMCLFLQVSIPLAVSGKAMADTSTSDSLSRTYLALGDSYTIGESVGAKYRFPAQTETLLRTMGIRLKEPQYISQTGWTTADLQDAIKQLKLLPEYDYVSLLIGVNDQYQGMDTAGYKKRFTQLLRKAIQLAGDKTTHVFVLSIPDYGVTPFGGGAVSISKEIDDFNVINKEISATFHVTYIDITPISRLAANDQSLTAMDGLHPSGKQYQQWAQKLAMAIQRAVAKE